MRLIDADALRRRKELRFGLMAAITTIQFLIDEAPTVEERKHGRWIHRCCSICNARLPSHIGLDYVLAKDFKYCYNCGAIMDGEIDYEIDRC